MQVDIEVTAPPGQLANAFTVGGDISIASAQVGEEWVAGFFMAMG